MSIKTENKKVEVEKVKVQQNSVGTINNATINSIIFGYSSSLNIAGFVELVQSSIDLTYNNIPQGKNTRAPLTGHLTKSPSEIIINAREDKYLEDDESFLIAESSDPQFECEEWKKTFLKGPFNSKFKDAYCIYNYQNSNGERVNRMFAATELKSNGCKNNDKDKLPFGAIIGIVIGCVVIVALIIVLVVFAVVKKEMRAENSEDEDEESGMGI